MEPSEKKYKLYNYHGSSTKHVPDRTKRRWKLKSRNSNVQPETRETDQTATNRHISLGIEAPHLHAELENTQLRKRTDFPSTSANDEAPTTENESQEEALTNLSDDEETCSISESAFHNSLDIDNVQQTHSDQIGNDFEHSNGDCSSSEEEMIDPQSVANDDDSETNENNDMDLTSSNTGHNSHHGYPKEMLKRALLLMAAKSRFNLTYGATENISSLLQTVIGDCEQHISKFVLKGILDKFSATWSIHHICNHCGRYAGQHCVKGNEQIQLRCESCDENVDVLQNLKSGTTFLYLSLTEQLKHLMETCFDIIEYRDRRTKERYYGTEDIYDGKIYKKMIQSSPDSSNALSITFGFDGVPIFESSNYSTHPILCTVNELPPKLRRKHMMLCSIWCGKEKPVVNEYFKPFVAECQSLHKNGFQHFYKGAKLSKKCSVLMGICDSVARPQVQMSTQFNGEFGCSFCLHPGEQISKGKGTVRVYPQCPEGCDVPYEYSDRTHESTLIDAINETNGIKGRSILFDIPMFDTVIGLPPEWMHLVGLGLCRGFPKLWFHSQYHEERFYFAHKLPEIDSILMSYKPTLEISRTPRKISEYRNWKAHECMVWLLFYSIPTLKKVFPMKFVRHWALLVEGISLLVKRSVSTSEIYQAENLLLEFITGVEELYGREHVSFNVHLLKHLPQSVRSWGPLWTHSAFGFEDFNQEILKSVKSSAGVAMQIVDNYRLKCCINRLQQACEEDLTPAEQQYLKDTLSRRTSPPVSQHVSNAQMIGGAVTRQLSREHFIALQRTHVQCDPTTYVQYYKRANVNGELLHAMEYSRSSKRSNHYVILKNREIFEISTLAIIPSNQELRCYAIGWYYEKDHTPIIPGRQLNHLIGLKKRIENLAAIDACDIREKVILLKIGGATVSVACIYSDHNELLT